MLHITIDDADALELLMDRLAIWSTDATTEDLFRQYYTDMLDAGAFEGTDFNVMVIVDNDYVNNFKICTVDEAKEEYGDNFDEGNIYATSGDYVLYYRG